MQPPCLCTCHEAPDPLIRPLNRLRDADSPQRGYLSFRAFRGFRPGDYFTRGTSVGGSIRAGGVAGVAADVRAGDGFAWRLPTCEDVPKISACSRFQPPQGYLLQKASESRSYCPHPDTLCQSSSSECSSEGPPPVCVCTAQVETKTHTTNAFTMMERQVRNQGTMVDLQTANKAVATSVVKRDVATDTDDKFELYTAGEDSDKR